MEVLAGREEVPFDELHKLKLLRSILYETLRLYPPVAFMARTSVKDTQVRGLVRMMISKNLPLIKPSWLLLSLLLKEGVDS
jgi:cytochrome P450